MTAGGLVTALLKVLALPEVIVTRSLACDARRLFGVGGEPMDSLVTKPGCARFRGGWMLGVLLGSRSKSDCSPEQLMKAIVGYQNAEQECADQLIRCVTPLLVSLFSRPYSRKEQVEDLVQEAWLRIHRARQSYRPGEPPLPWILAIARHTRVDEYRKHVRSAGRESAFEALPADLAPLQPNVEEELEFDELLSHLPQSQREVLVMLKVFGMSVDEVARATSSGPSAVKQRAHRAYETIRKLIGHDRNGRNSDS